MEGGTLPPPAPPVPPAPPKQEDAPKVVLPFDATNEAIIVAAAYVDAAGRSVLLSRLVPDHFQQREHREIWTAFQEAERRKLVIDLALLEQLASGDAAKYLAELAEIRPEPPKNLAYHLQCVLWDHARITASRGPVPAFIESLRDGKAEPDRVKGLARSIVQCFEGYEDRRYLLDGGALVRDQMREVEARAAGRSCWNYGMPGLDYVDRSGPKETWRRRMIPGAAPGQITCITGVSGAGKTTFTANAVLGISFPGWADGDFEATGRSLLYGAWEMQGGMTLEIMAGMSLGWSRSEMLDPRPASPNRAASPILTEDGRARLQERMGVLAARIKFLANPFRRRAGEKASNERNLDILHGYISDSGCEVFVADLWKRCLRSTEPDDEEEALIRQQMMCEETRVHGILLQQQRLKDIEQRQDKRPTREGIKGTGAWVEIPDTIIGVHRPFLFKRVDDDKLEGIILKQRYGGWPLGIEFGWNADTGLVTGGRPIDYDRPGTVNEVDQAAGLAAEYRKNGKGGRAASRSA